MKAELHGDHPSFCLSVQTSGNFSTWTPTLPITQHALSALECQQGSTGVLNKVPLLHCLILLRSGNSSCTLHQGQVPVALRVLEDMQFSGYKITYKSALPSKIVFLGRSFHFQSRNLLVIVRDKAYEASFSCCWDGLGPYFREAFKYVTVTWRGSQRTGAGTCCVTHSPGGGHASVLRMLDPLLLGIVTICNSTRKKGPWLHALELSLASRTLWPIPLVFLSATLTFLNVLSIVSPARILIANMHVFQTLYNQGHSVAFPLWSLTSAVQTYQGICY